MLAWVNQGAASGLAALWSGLRRVAWRIAVKGIARKSVLDYETVKPLNQVAPLGRDEPSQAWRDLKL
jgi:hypothetical protein